MVITLPHFLENFIDQVRKKKDLLRELLLGEERDRKYYEKYFTEHWNALDIVNVERDIIAIDSSDGHIELKTGNIIQIVRAIGVGKNGFELKFLQVNPITQPIGDADFTIFRGYAREHLEHIVTLECIKRYNEYDSKPFILVDGSLYGRISHFPQEIDINGFYDFLLHYYKTLSKLFNESKQKNIPLVGVSKDSKTQFFRLLLLEMLLKDTLNEISDQSLKNHILFLWSNLLKRKIYTIKAVYERLSPLNPPTEKILEIFREAINFYADSNLISNLAHSAGYSTPVLLGRPIYTLDPLISSLTKNVEIYIKQRFPRSIQLYGKDFIEIAKSILSLIPKLPAIISFHVLFNINDIPIRVDVPAYVFGIDKTIESTNEWGFIEVDKQMLNKIISLLHDLYLGLEHYNILIEEADRRVKLHKHTITEIYEKVLANELGVLLEHSRGDRRVKFP